MQALIHKMHLHMSAKVLVAGFVALSAVLFLAPRAIDQTKAESCTIYQDPVFNPFPETMSSNAGTGCTDFPVISVRNTTSTTNDYSKNVSSQNGDEFYVRVYVHNGAAQGLNPNHTTMHNVQVQTSVDVNPGTSHSIQATLSAGASSDGYTPASKSGSVVINTPAGGHLEIIPGSAEIYDYTGRLIQSGLTMGNNSLPLGDQQACFEFARQIRFKVRVVVPAPTQELKGTISGRVDQCIVSTGTFSGVVDWSVSGTNDPIEVTVRDPQTGAEKLFGTGTSGHSTDINWFIPNNNYRFTVWRIVNGQRTSFYGGTSNLETWVQVGPLNCSEPAQPKSFTLTASNFCVGTQPTYAITGTSNLVNKPIVWSSTLNGVPTGENNSYVGQTISDSNGLAYWTDVGGTWQASHIGHWTKTATIDGVVRTATFDVKECSTPPVYKNLICSPKTQAAQTGQTVYFSASQGTGTYTWSGPGLKATSGASVSASYATAGTYTVTATDGKSSDTCSVTVSAPPAQAKNFTLTAANFCIGTQPTYTITGTSNLVGKPIYWSSTLNGQATGENNAYVGQTIADAGGLSYWTDVGGTWQASHKGHWTKTATIDGVVKTATFDVIDCNPTPPPAPLVCNPTTTQTVAISQPAFFNATGGKGTYTWSAPSAIQPSGSGVNFSSAYNASGDYTVNVSDGASTASCRVHVNPSAPVCVVNANASLTNTAITDMGNGRYQTTINYAFTGSNPVKIVYTDPASGQEVVFASGLTASGSKVFSGFLPNQNYVFKMVDTSSCGGVLATLVVRKDFTATPTLQCTPTGLSIDPGQPITFTAIGGTGTYSWHATNGQSGTSITFPVTFTQSGNQSATVTSGSQTATCNVIVKEIPVQPKSFTVLAANFCVGTNATYQFTGTANLASLPITGSSVFTPVSGPVQNQDNGVIGTTSLSNGLATFFTTGRTWTAADIGHWKRTFTLGGIQQSAEFDVIDCNPTPPPAQLICNPNTVQTVGQSQPVYFNATGGTGTYSWSAPSGSPVTGSGSTFSTQYSAAGTYQVTVTSGSSNAVCGVHVNPPQYQQLQCVPPTQTSNVNQTVYFSATGGNGSYAWSAPNASQTSGTGSSFNASYAGSGYQTVTVTSGDGQQAVCSVNVIAIQPTTLICSPPNQTANSGQTVYFSAYGGSGSYSWTASNGQTGSGTSFQTSFSATGAQSATVRSGDGQQATCYANINPIQVQNGYLMISKWVAHAGQSDFSSTITAETGARVSYKIQVTAQNGTVTNVQLSDYFSLPGSVSFVNGTLKLDGTTQSDSSVNTISLGTLSAGQSRTVTFDAYVTAQQGNNQTIITNTATASGQNTGSVTATATVIVGQGQVQGGNITLVYNKRAFNDSKNADATAVTASKEDYITYTLTVQNTGNSPAENFVITDDLSQVLPYADFADYGGGTVSGNVITFPGLTIPAGGSVSKSFRVRVKYFLADNLSYTMTNTYGNTVVVRINTPQVLGAFVAPTTGADTMAVAFGGMAMAGYAIFRKRSALLRLILN